MWLCVACILRWLTASVVKNLYMWGGRGGEGRGGSCVYVYVTHSERCVSLCVHCPTHIRTVGL